MFSTLSAVALILVAIIHLLPLVGVLGAETLTRLYGIEVDSADLSLLLRHRAVLFGLVGAGLVASAILPTWRPAAYVAAFVSVVSFLVLAALESPTNAALTRVLVADLIALGLLLVGLAAEVMARQSA